MGVGGKENEYRRATVAGRKPGSRNRLSDEIISSFLRDWRKHGDKALEKVRRTQPAAYCKLAVLLVPKEGVLTLTLTSNAVSTGIFLHKASRKAGGESPGNPLRRVLPGMGYTPKGPHRKTRLDPVSGAT
jgi:hypothetical protein